MKISKNKALTTVTSALVMTSALAFSPTANAEELASDNVNVVAETSEVSTQENAVDNNDIVLVATSSEDSENEVSSKETTEEGAVLKTKAVEETSLYYNDGYDNMPTRFSKISDNLKIVATNTLADIEKPELIIHLTDFSDDPTIDANTYLIDVDGKDLKKVEIKFSEKDEYKELERDLKKQTPTLFTEDTKNVSLRVTDANDKVTEYTFTYFMISTSNIPDTSYLDDEDENDFDFEGGSGSDSGEGKDKDSSNDDDLYEDAEDDDDLENAPVDKETATDDKTVDIGMDGNPSDDDDDDDGYDEFNDAGTSQPSVDDSDDYVGDSSEGSSFDDSTFDDSGDDSRDSSGDSSVDDSTFDDSSSEDLDSTSGDESLPQTGHNESNALPISGGIALLLSVLTFGLYRKKATAK